MWEREDYVITAQTRPLTARLVHLSIGFFQSEVTGVWLKYKGSGQEHFLCPAGSPPEVNIASEGGFALNMTDRLHRKPQGIRRFLE